MRPRAAANACSARAAVIIVRSEGYAFSLAAADARRHPRGFLIRITAVARPHRDLRA